MAEIRDPESTGDRILNLCEETCRGLEEIQTLQSGGLIIGASQTTGTYLMPRLIGIFRHKYPQITIELQVHSTRRIAWGVSKGPRPTIAVSTVWHLLICPARHAGQVPQEGGTAIITLSPSVTRVTSEPALEIMPVHSWPHVEGQAGPGL